MSLNCVNSWEKLMGTNPAGTFCGLGTYPVEMSEMMNWFLFDCAFLSAALNRLVYATLEKNFIRQRLTVLFLCDYILCGHS